MCEAADRYLQFVAERAKPPPLTSGDTLHWDGRGVVSQGVELMQGAAPVACPVLPVEGHIATGRLAPARVPPRPLDLLPSSPASAIDWATAAACLTFYLDPGLLLASVRAVPPTAIGTLLWVHGQGDGEPLPAAVHPALLVQTASALCQKEYVKLVPQLPRRDPLLHHIALVLQTAVAAEGVAGRLYAETLANALASHLLRRYAACRHPAGASPGGLTPSKLRRTTAYIQAHLEHALPLTVLAAVAQMSPAHFARLFKLATGRTPHQYVILCRMERAKRLLVETDMPLIEIGPQVGCADQSHFTALFRKHVSMTPQAYRNTTGR